METDYLNINEIERIAKLADKIARKKDGNRARQLVRSVSKHYFNNPKAIRKFFSYPNEFIRGIATSAYSMITGDIIPCTEHDCGGWGITLNEGGNGLYFSRHQLWFSKIGGNALEGIRRDGNASWYSVNDGNSSANSRNNGNSLWNSENGGNAFLNSLNVGWTLAGSINRECSFRESIFKQYAIFDAQIFDNSLENPNLEELLHKDIELFGKFQLEEF